MGLQPDCLICRLEKELPQEEKKKIALFCSVDPKSVISMHDAETVYSIPLLLNAQGVDKILLRKLNLSLVKPPKLNDWKRVVEAKLNPKKTVSIAVVGKYVDLKDSYKSLNEALDHAGIVNLAKVQIDMIDATKITRSNVSKVLKNHQAVLIPGGFGSRGVEGMIHSCEYARLNKLPYFGICLGMQIAIIEFSRNVLGLKNANSTEFKKNTKNNVISLVTEWKNEDGTIEKRDQKSDKGGTMRLGAQKASLKKGTLARQLYINNSIYERHRHRYEVNPKFKDILVNGGMDIVGTSLDGKLAEMIEIKKHPWFLGCQFHPEFTSNPRDGHPIFNDFILKAIKIKR